VNNRVKQIPIEPYPQLQVILKKFTAGVQNALAENFVGAYLVGSLATGDFDLDSDIDFLIVTNAELTEPQLGPVQAFHVEIYGLGCYPARHLEGSYISRGLLAQADLVGVQPLWYVDNGSTLLQRSVHDNRWHVRWILRERAITLMGPSPEMLMPPVSLDALRAEMLTSLEKLKTRFLAEIGEPPTYFNTRFGQSFAVLTCCRVLHTLQSGIVQSKRSSMQWAERSLKAEWRQLIQQAWAERNGVRFGVKVRQPADVNSCMKLRASSQLHNLSSI
jgi:Domain of unknown function (DUF4111)/Nucleotidyltransferase domain